MGTSRTLPGVLPTTRASKLKARRTKRSGTSSRPARRSRTHFVSKTFLSRTRATAWDKSWWVEKAHQLLRVSGRESDETGYWTHMSTSRRIARPLLASMFVAGGWDAFSHPEGK